MRIACIHFSSKVELPAFAQSCLRFSPQIALREPNAIFIEIGRCKNLYSESSFLARLQVLLNRFRATAKVTLSNDIPTALAMAEYSIDSIEALPLDALHSFGDPFMTNHKDQKNIEKMTDNLKRLGLKTIEQFMSLPSVELPSRFGSIGIYCKQVLEGSISLPWPRWEPPTRFFEKLELGEFDYCASLEPLLFLSKEVLDRLFSRLKGASLAAEKIEIILELEKYSTVKVPVRTWEFDFITPQTSTACFIPILRERLSTALQKAPIESHVVSMSCEATSVTFNKGGQKNFFNEREENQERMGALFGQLSEFLGKENVFWARTTEERLPENSWMKSKDLSAPSANILGKYPKRPTRIFKKPIPISIIEDRLSFKGKKFKILSRSSVERLSLDWIDDCPARNYYRYELDSGSSIWVFSDPSHHFFIHGYFE